MSEKHEKHPKGIFERDGIWYAELKFKGKRYRWSSKSPRKTDAKNLRDTMKRKLLDGTYRDGATRITLHDLREAMLADVQANGRKYEKRVEQCFTHLERLIGADTTADRIEDHLDSYVQKRLSEKVGDQEDEKNKRTTARATVNQELACLRRGFRLMVRRRRLAIIPHIELLAANNVRTRFPSEDEIGQVIAKLPEGLQGPIRFVALSGWRVGEALGLSWRSVDRKSGTIRLEASETKGKDVRTLPYADDPRLKALILRDGGPRPKHGSGSTASSCRGCSGTSGKAKRSPTLSTPRRGCGPARRRRSRTFTSTIYAAPTPGTRYAPEWRRRPSCA